MTAIERFKALYANAVERVCVLEEQLERAQARIAELETGIAEQRTSSADSDHMAKDAK
jgi:hypothetical protein